MVISRATECAVRAMVFIAGFPPDQVVAKQDICRTQEITPAFLIKIMQPLRAAGLVNSYRGVAGGFTLAKPPAAISLWDIVCAIEGPVYLNKCMVRASHCNRDTVCKVHQVWHKAKADLEHTLRQATLSGLVQENSGGLVQRE